MNRNKVGYIYILLASFFFALIAVIGKSVMNLGIGAYDLIIMQYGLTSIILFVYFIITDIKKLMITSKQFLSILLQGFIGSSLTNIFFYLALERVNAGTASMLLFTHPVLVSVYFIITKTKKITLSSNFALVFAILGSAFAINVFKPELARIPLFGIVFGIGASITYAFYNIYLDLKLQGINPMIISFCNALINCFVAILINPDFFQTSFTVNGQLIAYVINLSVVSGILPVIFLYKGIGLIGSDKASIAATAELPITLLISYAFLGESIDMIQFFGVVLIITSIVVLQNEERLEKSLDKIANIFHDI